MATDTKIGIKTLSNRVSALESAVSSTTPLSTGTFADQLIKVTATSLKDDLQTVLSHYEDGLKSLGIDINNFQLVDLVKAIPYTITYVEQNASVIAGLLKKDLSSTFKLNTALTFIKQYIEPDEKFLIAYIQHEVDLLFNNGKNTLTDILPNTKASSVSTGTITKSQSKKFKLSFSKK